MENALLLAALYLAEEAATIPAGWGDLAQYGLAGMVIAALAWFALGAWRRETLRGDQLAEENRQVHLDVQEKAIPALLAAAQAMTEVTELLRDLQREQRDREIARMRRDGDPR